MLRATTLPLFCAVAAALSGCESIDRAAHVATGYVSHQLCSAAFVSGLDPQQFQHDALKPMGGPLGFLLRQEVDAQGRQVTARLAGMAESRAVYRGTLGCLVARDPVPAAERIDLPAPAPALLPEIAGPATVEPTHPVVRAAFDRAFSETQGAPQRGTKADRKSTRLNSSH